MFLIYLVYLHFLSHGHKISQRLFFDCIGHLRPEVRRPLGSGQVAPGEPAGGGHEAVGVKGPDRDTRPDVDRQGPSVGPQVPLQPRRLGADGVTEPDA